MLSAVLTVAGLTALAPHDGLAQPPGAPIAPLAAWVELSPTGPVVRVITQDAVCPRAAAVGAPDAVPAAWDTPMAVRASPAPPNYPNLVCEWQPPPDARYVAVEGQPGALRMPSPDPRRIVVFGDSGCLGGQEQDCARDWYFPDIVRFAAARHPDLVIHVGDYNYRGTNCVAYDGCCTYNPINCGFPDCGDNWSTWQADFFAPAAPLLALAPWVLVRGNHELCARAGRGWFRYLDPHSPPPTCAANPVDEPTYTAPYPLFLGDSLRLLIMDSANACGELQERDNIAPYREQFERLNEHAANGTSAQTWFVTHRPLWGILQANSARTAVLNYTLQEASGNRLPSSISLILNGHEHLFQGTTFEEAGVPPALMVGTGGGPLDNPVLIPEHIEHVPMGQNGPTVAIADTVHDHGYLLLERSDTGWSATFYDLYDQPRATCQSSMRPALCTIAGR